MNKHFARPYILSGILSSLAFAGCDRIPGKPQLSDRWEPPDKITDFNTLYVTNCRACHSAGSDLAPSLAMNNPVYLAVIPHDTLRHIVAAGVKGSLMPGFASSQGGDLTDPQVDSLVNGIYGLAKNQDRPADLPPYSAPLGDPGRGAAAYNTYCASCHGQDGIGSPKGGSIVDHDYLHIVTDQYLRSVTIAGRPELGMPNYQQYLPNKPMSADEIADVVAWVASHRDRQNPDMAASATQSTNPNHE
jgi:cytochrome c oxidase cbb3-type subunit 3